ncbi:MAG TPA: DUF4350 domain-containing protein [Bryobacteraceae bacterium]|nr:DUF4350 domain-containing protein [Bryobacteraceae bacterium]
MQTGLTPADRKLLAIAGGLFVALALATVLTAPAPGNDFSAAPSSYLSTPGGARAGFLLLERLGMKVQRWQEPALRFAEFAPAATLIIAEPTETPSGAERTALRQFVERGGRILFCGAELPSFFPQVQLKRLRSKPTPRLENLAPVLPKAKTYRPVVEGSALQSVELRADALWQKFGASQLPVYGSPNDAVVGAWTLGAGEVVWWTSATPLTNAGLERADNLSLFLNSAGAASGRRVYWDEYFHGERGSLWDFMGRLPAVRWAVVQFVLLACAAMLTFTRRSGPVIAPAKVSRASPLEFVETLGGLYRRANASPVAVDVNFRHLRLQLTRRLGLPGTISDADLASAAAGRLGWNKQELQDVLDQARPAAAARSFPSSPALKLVQQLQRFTARLAEKH